MRKLFRNKFTYIVAMTLVCAMSLAACGNKNAKAETESKKAVQDATESTKKAEKTEKIALSDGTYTAEFTTDSSMFHVNDAYDNKGTLTVKDGKATIHVTLTSTHIVNLFLGTAKDASKDKAELLEPTAMAQLRRSMRLIYRFLFWMRNLTLHLSVQRANGMTTR